MRRMLSRVPDAASSRIERVAGGISGSAEPAAALSEYEIPARSWTTPSWRSAAIRRRSSSDASTARTSSISRSTLAPAQAPCESPGEGHLDEPEEDEAREQERREREPDPAARRRDGSSPLVRLEEQRRPVRRPDREVDLVQAAQALLEAVLGPAEVAALRAALRPSAAPRASSRRAGISTRSAVARRSRRCARRRPRSSRARLALRARVPGRPCRDGGAPPGHRPPRRCRAPARRCPAP